MHIAARYACDSIAPGLWDGFEVGWLPSLGVTGGQLFSIGPRSNVGICTDVTWETPTQHGYMLAFNGTTSYVDMGAIEFIPSAPFTVSVDIYRDGDFATSRRVLLQGDSASTYRAMIASDATATNELQCFVTTGTSSVPVAAFGAIADKTWSRLVWTRDANGTDATYINGIPSTGTPHAVASGVAGGFYLGRRVTGNYFDQRIGDTYLWRRCLTGAEVLRMVVDPMVMVSPRSDVITLSTGVSIPVLASNHYRRMRA